MKFGEIKELLDTRDNVILRLSDRVVEGIGFDLGYKVDFYDRGYDIDDWMESTFDYAIGDYIDFAPNAYDAVALDKLGIDIWSYFDNKEVAKISIDYVNDFDGNVLVISIV